VWKRQEEKGGIEGAFSKTVLLVQRPFFIISHKRADSAVYVYLSVSRPDSAPTGQVKELNDQATHGYKKAEPFPPL
jgi:hypothetical protein